MHPPVGRYTLTPARRMQAYRTQGTASAATNRRGMPRGNFFRSALNPPLPAFLGSEGFSFDRKRQHENKRGEMAPGTPPRGHFRAMRCTTGSADTRAE